VKGRRLGEFALIGRMAERFRHSHPRVLVGIGDDAAVLEVEGGRVVATTDSLVEGVHFRWDLCRPADVGFKAVQVNLSDLAAMGSKPLAVLLGLCLPDDITDRQVLELADGVASASRLIAPVAGGNVSRTPGPLVVTVTALGVLDGGDCLRRDGARPGDAIMADGPIGSAALGLRLLTTRPRLARRYPSLVAAYRTPCASVDLGVELAEVGGVHAAIDVSDGLLADLGHVLHASRVGARLDADLVPIADDARAFCAEMGLDPVDAALAGGDDYRLVAFAAPHAVPALEGLGMTRIGEVIRGKGRFELFRGGRRVPMPPSPGYSHR